MNYFKIIVGVCLVLLTGCQSGYLATQDTIVPLPTFNQYSSNSILFRAVSLDDSRLTNAQNDTTSKLREGFKSYFMARFQEDYNYNSDIILTAETLEVTNDYLQVGGKNDVLSSWKSFEVYVFNSTFKINITCSNTGTEDIKTLGVSKRVKVPASYSLYKKELYLLTALEKYIESIDKEMLPYVIDKTSFCR